MGQCSLDLSNKSEESMGFYPHWYVVSEYATEIMSNVLVGLQIAKEWYFRVAFSLTTAVLVCLLTDTFNM